MPADPQIESLSQICESTTAQAPLQVNAEIEALIGGENLMFFVSHIRKQVGSLLAIKFVTPPARTTILFGIACSAVVILARAGAAVGFH